MYRLQTHWANCCTQTAYYCSIATWTDAAKDYYFNYAAADGADSAVPAEPAHPFLVGSAPWVNRCHSFLFHRGREYHSCTDYRSDLEISTAVTKVGRSSLDVEHAFRHVTGRGERELLCQAWSSIVVISPNDNRPAPHGLGPQVASLCAEPSLCGIPRELPAERPEGAQCYPVLTRFSDVDGHGHVNNSVLLSYLQNARLLQVAASMERPSGKADRRLRDVRSMHIEFLAPAEPDERLDVFTWPGPAAAGEEPQVGFFQICKGDGTLVLRARMDFAETLAKRPRTPKPRL